MFIVSVTKASEPGRRKLIAVVYADMVGYSRLISLDDAETIERLRMLRAGLIDPAIEQHGGRIVQTGGDSLLIVFDSIEGAVRCAVTVQQQVPASDSAQSTDRAILFRVGIDIGDAIADGTDLHGNAVNVAARLQTECPPGGICVSRAVRDHVHGRLDLVFEELGALKLKNIARPVEAFVLRPGAPRNPTNYADLDPAGSKSVSPPDKPSIAVLAFTNMSGDPAQEYFSDGIAESIITELSRIRWLFVIARNSSFTYRGRAVDVRQVARELGVRYVLEGSVQRSGDRVRVNVQLIDAEIGGHVWADRYDRRLEDVFAVQDEITEAVMTAIGPAISHAERQRAIRKPPENLDAWEAYQRALWHHSKGGAADADLARDFLEHAIRLDPLFATARGMLAFSYIYTVNFGTPLSLQEAVAAGEAEGRRAIELDPDEPTALTALAWVAFFNGDCGDAAEHAQQAISGDPNYAGAYLAKGLALAYSGRTNEAREAAMLALRLNPRDSWGAIARHLVGVTHYLDKDYPNAVAAARVTVRDHPDFPQPYRYLAAALGQLGRTDEARTALQQAIAISHASFDFHVNTRQPWFRPEDHEHMLEGLRKAGWQG
jgi:adenylate cyclase